VKTPRRNMLTRARFCAYSSFNRHV